MICIDYNYLKPKAMKIVNCYNISSHLMLCFIYSWKFKMRPRAVQKLLFTTNRCFLSKSFNGPSGSL